MIRQTTTLYQKMSDVLEEINSSSEDRLQYAERSYYAVRNSVQQLNSFIQGYEFKNADEEILFFKEVKPKFVRELILFMEQFHLEANIPISDEAQRSYLKQATERINSFFERNHQFYIYYRMGKADHDAQYFVRQEQPDYLQPESAIDIDRRISTVYSYKLSEIQAFESLNDYIKQRVYLLDHPELTDKADEKKAARNVWTDSQAALFEFIYALHARGSVNHGKGTIKQLITGMEIAFNVKLGNAYRTAHSMKIRKKNLTPYLDALKESYLRWVNDSDLNYR